MLEIDQAIKHIVQIKYETLFQKGGPHVLESLQTIKSLLTDYDMPKRVLDDGIRGEILRLNLLETLANYGV